jgi:hypothetical protein
MLARDLQEIRSVRMRVRSSPAARTDLEAAIRTVLEKHEIKLSAKLLSELMLTVESELDTISGASGPLLPVGINRGPTILPRPLETRDTRRDTTGHLSAAEIW